MSGSPRPWHGERTVTPTEAAELIAGQFPALAHADVTPLGSGWDNVAVLVGGDIVFRFPKSAGAATRIETEARVLPRLVSRLTLRIPRPDWVGEPTEGFPWPFAGYRRVPGQPGCGARLARNARRRNAPVLGEFLAALHEVPVGDLELPGDELERADFVKRMPLMVERLGTIEGRGLIDSTDPWLDLFRDLEGVSPPVGDTVVHGDLYARHLLVDDHDRLTGVIDWGDVHAGDAAMDLMLLYGFLPASARPGFERAYGPIPDDVRRMARLRAAFHAVSVTWYGLELPDEDLAWEGRQAMDFVLEE